MKKILIVIFIPLLFTNPFAKPVYAYDENGEIFEAQQRHASEEEIRELQEQQHKEKYETTRDCHERTK